MTNSTRESLAAKLENIISGHRINDDDAAWLRALASEPAPVAQGEAVAWRWRHVPRSPRAKPDGWVLTGRRDLCMEPRAATDELDGIEVQPLYADQSWISVEERMPAKGVEVLIAFRDSPLPATGQYTASDHDTWGWCFPRENDPDDTGPITHWMPLPRGPQS